MPKERKATIVSSKSTKPNTAAKRPPWQPVIYRSVVESHPRCYALGIIAGGRLCSVLERHLSLAEAVAFQEVYNRLDDDRQAVIVRDPIGPLSPTLTGSKAGAK